MDMHEAGHTLRSDSEGGSSCSSLLSSSKAS